MDANRLLFWQAMAVLALMVLLAFLKRRTRKSGLDRYIKRKASRRYVAAAPHEPDEH